MRASGVFDFSEESGNLFIVLMGISGRPILKIMLMSNFSDLINIIKPTTGF